MGLALLLFSAWTGALSEAEEAAVELRALWGYLGLYARAAAAGSPSAESGRGVLASDLRARLEGFLDRADLPPSARAEGIELYHRFARAAAQAPRGQAEEPGGGGSAAALRDLYSRLVGRARAAEVDAVGLELEMLASPVGLSASETYSALARLGPRLRERAAALTPEETASLRAILRRLLQEPEWPGLEGGGSLLDAVELLLKLGGKERAQDLDAVATKLRGWTARLLKAEAGGEKEIAQGNGLIHLLRTLTAAGPELDPAQRAAVIGGLWPLAQPIVHEGPAGGEGALRAVEAAEVRIPAGGGLAAQQVPPLPAALWSLSPPGYLLVPRKSYEVRLVATPEAAGPPSTFWVLARAGADARLVLPRSVAPGMVPITSAETGRITFLADRKPWSIRRFLLAFQRCGNSLARAEAVSVRLYRYSVLREIPLPPGTTLDFSALVDLLTAPASQERLEEVFWIEAAEDEAQATAFEIAAGVLSGNTGLRDTALSMPTVAEASRLWRDGEHFALELPAPEHRLGLFNATRLVPEPRELGERPRYAIRTVLRPGSP